MALSMNQTHTRTHAHTHKPSPNEGVIKPSHRMWPLLSSLTHTLTIPSLFKYANFSAFTGVSPLVSVHVRVCFSWMSGTGGLSPTWFFQKLNCLQRAARWPLSLSFHPLLLSGTFMYLFSQLLLQTHTLTQSHLHIWEDPLLLDAPL